MSSEGAELGFKSAMPGDLQFIGLSSLNGNMLSKTPNVKLHIERGIISVFEAALDLALWRQWPGLSSLPWQSALLQDLEETRPLPG